MCSMVVSQFPSSNDSVGSTAVTLDSGRTITCNYSLVGLTKFFQLDKAHHRNSMTLRGLIANPVNNTTNNRTAKVLQGELQLAGVNEL